MNKLSEMLRAAKDLKEFGKNYFNYLSGLMDDLDLEAVRAFAEELELARQSGNTIFFIGNGGSAATASHDGRAVRGDIPGLAGAAPR